jgi:hypothetical protein
MVCILHRYVRKRVGIAEAEYALSPEDEVDHVALASGDSWGDKETTLDADCNIDHVLSGN